MQLRVTRPLLRLGAKPPPKPENLRLWLTERHILLMGIAFLMYSSSVGTYYTYVIVTLNIDYYGKLVDN